MSDEWTDEWSATIGAGARMPGPAEWFEGSVELEDLLESASTRQLAVYFSAGARTRPHVHSGDQLLVCHSGEGVVAIFHAPTGIDAIRRIRPGDIVRIPSGSWHWHGATRSSEMCHVSIQPIESATTWDDIPLRDWTDYRGG